MISRKPMQLWITKHCPPYDPGNPFILGSKGQKVKGQGHEAQNTVQSWAFALLRVLASSSFLGNMSSTFFFSHCCMYEK